DPPHIRTAVRTGDTPSHVRQSMVKKPPHILITTPESLYLLLTSEKGRLIFRHLRYIILDEIHALSNNKRGLHLSLSLERLLALVQGEPVRIGLSATQKPLGRIAHFLGGQSYDPASAKHARRPVAIVDAGQRKDIDLQVISPVETWNDVPDASVWPLVIVKCYDLITAHKNTLVFVNMRAQAEKTARQLNELHRERTKNPAAVLALAHHGSLSREMRYDIEARLKAGAIPAVIATASLELGIDIGSIDLVVQLQSPGSVSAGLQRIGRSGHLLTSTSVGRIMPLFQADVDDCVAITQAILGRDIEETSIPENALDVLAQQIVAEVSMRDWLRLDLYHLVRNSYCYRSLSEIAFNTVVTMLSRAGDSELRALQPRLTWDRVNDRLITRRGSRLLAVMSGGVIADRAHYGVYLEGANSRLGEVEEEFVYESKVGDIFFLGNNEWRINEITSDRILVTPRGAAKAKEPFWKGEPAFRDFMTSRKIGAFRKKIVENEHLSSHDIHADESTLAALRSLLLRQQRHTGQIPTDHDIVVEYFQDAVGEPQVVVHAPFGGRVVGAWATALASAMEHRFGAQVQFSHDNDGMLFRLPDVEATELDRLLNLPFSTIKKLLIETIANTPMFIVAFRHNATRALLLARSRADRRIPLWLQRLRAADLLQAVREMPDFPIVVETYRECLEDLFDIDSLKIVLDEIGSGETRIHHVRTSSPSPMTAGLLFRFLSEQMYDYDRFRTVGHAADVSSELLADILARKEIPTIISKELISKALDHWQHLHPDRHARDAEECYDIIDKLGPITRQDLAARCARDPADWLVDLARQNRIQRTEEGWISHSTRTLQASADKKELVRRYLRHRGPQTLAHMTAEMNIKAEELHDVLSTLQEDKEIARGLFVIGEADEQWCDRDNLSFLYRQAIAARRRAHEPADRAAFMKFQMQWHHIARPHTAMPEVIRQYAGLIFPLYFFERDLLPHRLSGDSQDMLAQLADLVAEGEIVPIADKAEGGRFYVRFNQRGQEHLFQTKEELDERAVALGADAQVIFRFLKENGASLYHDIRDGAGLPPIQVDESLTLLCRRGLLSCDHLPSFYAILQNEPAPAKSTAPWHEQIRQSWPPSYQSKNPALRNAIKSRLRGRQGRWFLTSSFAVMGKMVLPEKRIEAHARLLLQRYGIVVKELYRHEQGLAPWYAIFQVLKRMEWSGEIRRGYFIQGFSGVQFASDEALQVLEQQSAQPASSSATCLLSTIDPALPFGGQLEWGLAPNDGAIAAVRSAANHVFLREGEPLVYLENWGMRLFLTLHADAPKLADLPELLKRWLRQPEPLRPRKKIELVHIDARPAAQHELASLFTERGFEIDGDRLVLWPSSL
ncbi:DEAD/DEAH box helicase, partial [candidate division KSB1 bacterium]